MVELELYLEVVNCLVAIVIAIVGFQILGKLKDELRQAWMFFLGAMVLFALHEVNGTLMEFNLFQIDGLYSLTEFIYIVAFFVSMLIFRNLFTKLDDNKKKVGEKK